MAHDGPAEQTSISPAVASPPLIGATPTSGRGAASSCQFARRNCNAFAHLKRSIARSIYAGRCAARPTSARTDDVESSVAAATTKTIVVQIIGSRLRKP
jgi:hypothetical protein